MPLSRLLFLIAGVLVLSAGCGGGDSAGSADRDKAVAAARFIYAGKASSLDLSSGPCLAESIPSLSDWAVDIAHDPRQAVDDQAANQCQSFRDGETHHFVELTPRGQLIRAQ